MNEENENKKEVEQKDKNEKEVEQKDKNEKELKTKNKNEKEPKQKSNKQGFWKKVYKSVTKIEDYPEMAAEGFGKAMGYLAKMVAILTIVLCMGMIYQTYQMVQKGILYLENEFPEFSYQEGKLDIQSEEPIKISTEDSVVGYTVIDTKTEEQQTINQYIKEIEDNGSGVLVLKDKVILKNAAVSGTISYEYKNTFEQMGITQFNKQDVISYAQSKQIISLYVSVFLTIFVYGFVMYFLTTISNTVFLAVFGYLTTMLAKIKMRFVAVFNMAVYALSLSIILNMIYIAINIFTNFNIEYFQVMYVSVAAIYLVAAIFLLKSEFIKKQLELMKIVEVQKTVKKEIEEEKKEEEKNENKETKKEQGKNKEDKKKKEKEQDENLDQEPEGSNA